ncbi:MAG: T9SS type A sorting domain-containing protein [Lewinellaceae bacterium]|nr:T9SS type A sorting domain-containing protein [Saprospiraceae bacterium]MCB9338794.1 T9SS type A sorting domain-containing protein [Lewinellaceae bacterium]
MPNTLTFRYFLSKCFIALICQFLAPYLSYGNGGGEDVFKAQTGFIENKGQIIDQHLKANQEVKYLFAVGNFKTQLRKDGFSYEILGRNKSSYAGGSISDDAQAEEAKKLEDIMSYRIDVYFEGTNNGCFITGEEPFQDRFNYYTPGTPEQGVTNVRHFRKIFYHQLYKGIDLEFIALAAGGQGLIKYNFILAPGADISQIKMRIEGAFRSTITDSGSISMKTPFGEILEEIPYSYFDTENGHQAVNLRYIRLGGNMFGIQGTETSEHRLIIDPTPSLSWGSYYGGTGIDVSYSITSDAQGNVVLGGWTSSSANIATAGAHQVAYSGGTRDGMAAKFTADGTRLWATYYGGPGIDLGRCIGSDSDGNIFLSGETASMTNIATTGAHQTELLGDYDAFLVKFDSAGIREWGTYYGGTGNESAFWFAVSNNGHIFLTGGTGSTDGVATPGSHQESLGGEQDAFLAKFSPGGALQWGTYYGGGGYDRANGINIGASGDLILTGETKSQDGIATAGVQQETKSGDFDAFIAKFKEGGALVWGTYYGGSNVEHGYSIVENSDGNIFMGGSSTSSFNIATTGSHQTTNGGGSFAGDGILLKLDSNGIRQWCTYFGGSGEDLVSAVELANGAIYICGSTSSSNSISTPGAHQTEKSGGYDGYLAKFTGDGDLEWASYYGGAGGDFLYNIDVGSNGSQYVTGETVSTTNISTVGAYQEVFGGGMADIVLARFVECGSFAPSASSNSPVCGGGPIELTASGGIAYSWAGPDGFVNQGQNPIVPNANSSSEGIYSVTITDADGCYESINLDIKVSPSVVLESNSPVCEGNTLMLAGIGDGMFSWAGPGGFQSNEQSPIIENLTLANSGSYAATVTLPNGCFNNSELLVVVNALPIVTFNLPSSDTLVCLGDNPFMLLGGFPEPGIYAGTGVTGNIFNPLAAGEGQHEISYVYTDNNGCSNLAVQTIIVETCSSIHETLQLPSLSIFPNPSNGLINIRLDNAVDSCSLIVRDLNGRKVFLEDRFERGVLDLSKFVSGIYFLTLHSKEWIWNGKIILVE